MTEMAATMEGTEAMTGVQMDEDAGLEAPKTRFEGGWRSPLLSSFSDLEGPEKSSAASTPHNITPTERSSAPQAADDSTTSLDLSSSPFFCRAGSVDSPPFASSSNSSPTKVRLSVSTGGMVPYGSAVAPTPFERASSNSPSPTRSTFPTMPRRTSLPHASFQPLPPLSFSADRAGGTKRRRAPAPGTIDFRELFGSSPFGSPGGGSSPDKKFEKKKAEENADAEKPQRPPRPVPTPSLVALDGISTPAQGWFAPAPPKASDVSAPSAPSIGFGAEQSVWSSCSSGTTTAATELPSPFAASQSIASLFPMINVDLDFEDPLSPSAMPGAPKIGCRSRSNGGSGSFSAENSPGAVFSPLPPTPGSASPIARTTSPVDYFGLRSRSQQSPLTSRRAAPMTTPALLKAPRLGGGDAFSPLPRTPGGQTPAAEESPERPKLLKSRFSGSDVSIARTSSSGPGEDVPSVAESSAEEEPVAKDDEVEGERDAGDGWTRADAARKRILLEWEARRSSSTPGSSDGSFEAGSISTATTTPEKQMPPTVTVSRSRDKEVDRERTPSPGRTRDRSALFKTPESDVTPSSAFSSPGSLSSGSSATPTSTQVLTPASANVGAGTVKTASLSSLSPLKTDLFTPSNSKLSPPARPGMSRSLSSPGGALGHTIAAGLPASPTVVFASSPLAGRVTTARGPLSSSALSDTDEEDTSDDSEDDEDVKVAKPSAAPMMTRSVSGGSFVSPLRRTVSRRSTFTAAAAIARRTAAANREAFAGLGKSGKSSGDVQMDEVDSEDDAARLDVVNAGNGVVEVAGTSIQCGLFAPTAIAIAGPSTSGTSTASRRRRANGTRARSSSRHGRASGSSSSSSSLSSTPSLVKAGLSEPQPDLPDLPVHSHSPSVSEATKAAFGAPAASADYTPPPLVPLSGAGAQKRLGEHPRGFNPYFPVMS